MKQMTAGSILKNKYRLERPLSAGGMGSLWLGFDVTLKRRVAVKFVRGFGAADEMVLARFEREACAAAQIRSAHVVETYDYGIDGGCAFIVMEYLEGEDLRGRLAREGRLSVEQTGTILVQLCKALDAVHAANVVHRDLKPSNVFISKRGNEELVKVLDFGIAKAGTQIFSMLTQSGMMLGTPRYMSPEQAMGAKYADFRTDLWATAVILYRMMTGSCPFFGTSTVEIVQRICRATFPKASELDATLPPAIDTFFEKAFSRSPHARFQSGRELVSAFFEVVTHTGTRISPGPANGKATLPDANDDRETVPNRPVGEQVPSHGSARVSPTASADAPKPADTSRAARPPREPAFDMAYTSPSDPPPHSVSSTTLLGPRLRRHRRLITGAALLTAAAFMAWSWRPPMLHPDSLRSDAPETEDCASREVATP